MALGLQTESGSGSFALWAKWDARSGRWYRKNPEPGGGDIDITNNFAAIFDLANIEVGWLLFAAGVAPNLVMSPLAEGKPLPPRPTDDHRQGVRLKVWLAKDCGSGLHEIAGTAKTLLQAIDKLHDDYLAQKDANVGKLPVVQMVGAIPVETETPKGKTRNFSPDLKIVGWAAWPKAGETPAVAAAPPPVPASTPVSLNDFG